MGLLSSIVTLPYAPVRMVTAVAKALQRQAEQELYSSASVRRQLEGLDQAAVAGEISDRERADGQRAVLSRLTPRADRDPVHRQDDER